MAESFFRISEDWAIDKEQDVLYYYENDECYEYDITGVSYSPYSVKISTTDGSLTLCKLASNYVGLTCDMDFDSYTQPIRMKWKSFIKSIF